MTTTTKICKTATTKKRAPRTTPEERREQATALHESITEQVEALRDSDQGRRFLAFASSFHRYRAGRGGVLERPEYVVQLKGSRRVDEHSFHSQTTPSTSPDAVDGGRFRT